MHVKQENNFFRENFQYNSNYPVYSVSPARFSQSSIPELLKSRLCVIVANEYNVGSNNG